MKTTGMTIWTFVKTYLLVLNKLEYVEEIQLDFKEIFFKIYMNSQSMIFKSWLPMNGSLR